MIQQLKTLGIILRGNFLSLNTYTGRKERLKCQRFKAKKKGEERKFLKISAEITNLRKKQSIKKKNTIKSKDGYKMSEEMKEWHHKSISQNKGTNGKKKWKILAFEENLN